MVNKIRILAIIIALLTLYGCTIKISRPAKELKLPQHIYQHPENSDYSQANVAIFRFEGPIRFHGLTSVLSSDPGHAAAHGLHQQLIQKSAFLNLIPAYDYEDLNLHEKIEIVKRDVRAERAQNSLIILVMHFLHDVPLQIETLPNEIRRNQIRPTHLTKIQSFHSGTNQQKGA